MRRRLYGKKDTVVGLDLSLTGTAACALPLGWDHDMYRARTMKSGYMLPNDSSPEDQVKRLITIVDDVVDFCDRRRAKHVYIENYAFSQKQSRAHALGELGGTVKKEVYQKLGLVVIPVVASRARKILLQHLPRADSKKFTIKNVKRLEGPSWGWTEDECDSFVVCNAGLMFVGGTAMSFPGEW